MPSNIDLRRAKAERLPELAADLVRLKVDLIVAAVDATGVAAKNASTMIPIVMTKPGDPVGLVWLPVWRGREAMSPGSRVYPRAKYEKAGNTQRAIPKLARVGFLRRLGGGAGIDRQMKELRPAALALKLKLEEIETHSTPKV